MWSQSLIISSSLCVFVSLFLFSSITFIKDLTHINLKRKELKETFIFHTRVPFQNLCFPVWYVHVFNVCFGSLHVFRWWLSCPSWTRPFIVIGLENSMPYLCLGLWKESPTFSLESQDIGSNRTSCLHGT